MDKKVEAVLAVYHERMELEWQQRRATAPEERGKIEWDQFLLAVGPDSGQLLNILCRSLERPTVLEIGTSYGYSSVWLAEAARASGGRVISIELQAYKVEYAREMAIKAGLSDHIEFLVGDALDVLASLTSNVDFVLVDLWKDMYMPCFELFYPRLNPGAIIVADNMIHPGGENAKRYADAIRAKPNMSSILVPVGTGLEISRVDLT